MEKSADQFEKKLFTDYHNLGRKRLISKLKAFENATKTYDMQLRKANQMLELKKTQVREMEEQLKRVYNEVKGLKKIKELEDEKSRLQRRETSSVIAMLDLEDCYKNAQTEIENGKEREKRKEDKIVELETKLTAIEKEGQSKDKDMEKLKKELKEMEELRQESKEMEKRQLRKDKELEETRLKLKEMEEKEQRMNQELEESEKKLKEIEEREQRMNEELKESKTKLKDMEEREQRMDVLEVVLEKSKNKLKEMEERERSYKEHLVQTKGKLNDAENKVSEFLCKLEDKEKIIAELEQQLAVQHDIQRECTATQTPLKPNIFRRTWRRIRRRGTNYGMTH